MNLTDVGEIGEQDAYIHDSYESLTSMSNEVYEYAGAWGHVKES